MNGDKGWSITNHVTSKMAPAAAVAIAKKGKGLGEGAAHNTVIINLKVIKSCKLSKN